MARSKNDDLLMEDELAAAFLGDSEATLVAEEEVAAAVVPDETPSEGEDGWDIDTEDLPGQLAVDVYETPDKLIVKARTAGISRSDLDVSISDNVLTISGILSGGEDASATKWHIQECYWGEFSRTIPLPVPIKEENVEAVLKDGVLTISFDKEKAEAPKKITIN